MCSGTDGRGIQNDVNCWTLNNHLMRDEDQLHMLSGQSCLVEARYNDGCSETFDKNKVVQYVVYAINQKSSRGISFVCDI